jgi:CheY-like chemotaxis protein
MLSTGFDAAADDSNVAAAVPNVVIVDPRLDAYKQLASSARLGQIGLHFRSSGADAIKLARRLKVDAWLISPDLDDMSGHDLVELLKERHEDAGQADSAKVAIVADAGIAGRQRVVAQQEATDAGADSLLSHPITLRDLERLIGLPVEERSKVFAETGAARAFITLPIGVGAAVVAIAVLMLG